MKNIETATPAAEVATVTATAKVKTQWTINVSAKDQGTVKDIVEEFELKNTMEAFALLYAVAESNRFFTRPVLENIGTDEEPEMVQTHDEDGQPVFETIDRWEVEANKISAARSGVRALSALEKLEAKMAELRRKAGLA